MKQWAKLHTELVQEHEAGCSGFVCDNQKLRSFISQQVDQDLANAYNEKISTVREVQTSESQDNVVLKKEEKNKTCPKNRLQLKYEQVDGIWNSWLTNVFYRIVYCKKTQVELKERDV